MRKIMEKYGKYMVVLIAITMVLPMLIINVPRIEAKTPTKLSKEDMSTASEISNTTGIEIEEILRLKNTGKTWNQVLNLLKSKAGRNNKKDKAERNELLVNSGIGEDYVDKLKEEGYSEDEIMEAKLLVERAIFQLGEITKTDTVDSKVPNEEISENKDEDIQNYVKILEKIELKTAVYLTLKLKEDFGSIERAFDEYLLALQLDIDLEEYFMDKEGYEKEKNEKSLGLGNENIITISKIGDKMLERLQNDNKKNWDTTELQQNINEAISNEQTNSDLPEAPKPRIDEVKPANPQDEIMKEIKVINPNDN